MFKLFKYFDLKYISKKVVGDRNVGELYANMKPFLKEKTKNFMEGCKDSREKLKDIPGTNFELGVSHLKRRNISDAIMRFKMVTFLEPKNADAYYYLGRSLILDGKYEEAEEALKKSIKLQGKSSNELDYLLQKITDPMAVISIPTSFIKENCELEAEYYRKEDDIYAQNTSKLLAKAILENISDKNPNLHILDIGCGKGENGKIFKKKEVAKQVIGVDFADEMVKSAQSKKENGLKIYDKIINGEMLEFLSNNKTKADVIILDQVMEGHKDMEKISALIKKSLKPKGIAAFVMEEADQEKGCAIVIEEDIFIHSMDNIKENMAKAGFKMISELECEIKEGVDGKVLIFSRP